MVATPYATIPTSTCKKNLMRAACAAYKNSTFFTTGFQNSYMGTPDFLAAHWHLRKINCVFKLLIFSRMPTTSILPPTASISIFPLLLGLSNMMNFIMLHCITNMLLLLPSHVVYKTLFYCITNATLHDFYATTKCFQSGY